MNLIKNKFQILVVYLGLATVTFIALEQVRLNDFIGYDDDTYVVKNQHIQDGITKESIFWAFTSGYASNWHPLTWISHMLDCEFYKLKPAGHHITNLILHIINTLLLFGILKAMTKAFWPSVFVAVLFALHPLHVESVAWVAGRKDVLSTLFWMLTMGAYVRYTNKPNIGRYVLVVILFALGLMSKPMLVTLPFVLLLLDYWPLERFTFSKENKQNTISPARLISEKIPLFIMASGSCLITFIVQHRSGAMVETMAFAVRLKNAMVSYLSYIIKMFYPSRLAVLYPHPGDSLALWQAIASFVVLVAITLTVIYLSRHRRYLAIGWLWYVGTLVPVIGLVQVGTQAMADRYTYLPLTGLFIMIAWGVSELTSKWRYRKIALSIPACVIIIALMVCTRTQTARWRNSIALFEHTISVTKNNYVIQNNLGNAFLAKEWIDKAIYHFRQALEVKPDYDKANYNFGIALKMKGRINEAISHYRQALKTNPNYAMAHFNLGNALNVKGEIDEAISHYRRAAEINPEYVEALNNLGNALRSQGKFNEAIGHYRQALQFNPDLSQVHTNLATVLDAQGKVDEAIEHFHEALRIRPDDVDAVYNLGVTLLNAGKKDQALEYFRQAAELKKNWWQALNALAWMLATHPNPDMRNSDEAIVLAQRAVNLTKGDISEALDTLAAAYASGGKFDEAIETAQKAIQATLKVDNKDLADNIDRRLRLYKAHKPYIEP